MCCNRDGNCVYVHRSTTGSVALDAPMAGSLTKVGKYAAVVALSATYGRETGDERQSGDARRADAARVAGYSAAKSGASISIQISTTMPALKQIGGIEFLLLAV